MATFCLTDGNNFVRVKSSAAITATAHSRCSAFCDHIGHVVCVATKKEMVRSNAARIVTAVANEGPGGDGAIGQFIGQAVSAQLRAILTLDEAVALRMRRARPEPAISWRTDGELCKETDSQRRFRTSSARHHCPRFILSSVRPKNQKFSTPAHSAWSASVHACNVAVIQPAPAVIAPVNTAAFAAQYNPMKE